MTGDTASLDRPNDYSVEKSRRKVRIRGFAAVAEAIHAQGEVPGSLHTEIGQEATGVGACIALRRDGESADVRAHIATIVA